MTMSVDGIDSLLKTFSNLKDTNHGLKEGIKQIKDKTKTVLGHNLKEALINAIDDPVHGKHAAEKLLKEFNITQKEAADILAGKNTDKLIRQLSESE